LTVKVAVPFETPSLAEISIPVVFVTFAVVTLKLTLEDPAGTRTDCGTLTTLAFALVSLTGQPPGGAADFNFTVPVELAPPTTLDGLKLRLRMLSPSTLSVAEALELPSDTSMVTVVVEVVGFAVISNFALSVPAGTITAV
jgi:hypothetical protein